MEKIEQDIQDIFDRLVKEKPNVSFVFSYVYSTSTDPAKAEPEGRVNMLGSAEEIQIHMDEIKMMFETEKQKGNNRKEKVYGNKKN